jgi:hypothetical protein
MAGLEGEAGLIVGVIAGLTVWVIAGLTVWVIAGFTVWVIAGLTVWVIAGLTVWVIAGFIVWVIAGFDGARRGSKEEDPSAGVGSSSSESEGTHMTRALWRLCIGRSDQISCGGPSAA